jgi:hypothetical protein
MHQWSVYSTKNNVWEQKKEIVITQWNPVCSCFPIDPKGDPTQDYQKDSRSVDFNQKTSHETFEVKTHDKSWSNVTWTRRNKKHNKISDEVEIRENSEVNLQVVLLSVNRVPQEILGQRKSIDLFLEFHSESVNTMPGKENLSQTLCSPLLNSPDMLPEGEDVRSNCDIFMSGLITTVLFGFHR